MHIPEGLTAVTPYLLVTDGAKAIDFYTEVFGATTVERHEEEGQVRHATLVIGGAPVELGEHPVERPPASAAALPPVGVHHYVEDVDAVLAKATERGAATVIPIMDQPYGDREVTIADPYGIVWFLATHGHSV